MYFNLLLIFINMFPESLNMSFQTQIPRNLQWNSTQIYILQMDKTVNYI